MHAVRSFLARHGKRLAPLVLGAAVLVIGHEWQELGPSDVAIEVPLGDDHREVTRIDLQVEEQGEPVRRISRRFPEGAPASVHETLELSPGDYQLDVRLERATGRSDALRGRVHAPAEGRVRVALEEAGR